MNFHRELSTVKLLMDIAHLIAFGSRARSPSGECRRCGGRPKARMRRIACLTCSAVISRVHSNCRGVSCAAGTTENRDGRSGAAIVPAAVAGVIVDDPVGRVELVGRVGKAADHHHRRARPPRRAMASPLDSPMKKSACLSQRARSAAAGRRSRPRRRAECGSTRARCRAPASGRCRRRDSRPPSESATISCQPVGLFQYLHCVVLCTAMQT